LRIARGSLAELETQLDISRRLGYIDDSKFAGLRDETDVIGKMLTNLIKSLRMP
jgi:four helix bundle protein